MGLAGSIIIEIKRGRLLAKRIEFTAGETET